MTAALQTSYDLNLGSARLTPRSNAPARDSSALAVSRLHTETRGFRRRLHVLLLVTGTCRAQLLPTRQRRNLRTDDLIPNGMPIWSRPHGTTAAHDNAMVVA